MSNTPQMVHNDTPKIREYFHGLGVKAYKTKDMEDLAITLVLLPNDTVAVDAYLNGIRTGFESTNKKEATA